MKLASSARYDEVRELVNSAADISMKSEGAAWTVGFMIASLENAMTSMTEEQIADVERFMNRMVAKATK